MMARSVAATLVTVCTLLLASPLVSCKQKRQAKHDVVDSFKSLENFPYAIGLYDVNRSGDLDCLNAVRKDLETDPPSATYIVSLKDKQGDTVQDFTYYAKPGSTPDRQVVIIDNDYDHPKENIFIYSDYESCIVMKFFMKNREECALWVTSEVKDAVPQTCVEQFQEHCDGELTYDKESCGGLIH